MIGAIFLPFAMLAAAQDTPAVAPSPTILFGFYRIMAFRDRAEALGCGGGELAALNAQYDALRKRLIERYGQKPFSPPRSPSAGGPGDCGVVLSVYRLNFTEYRILADADLAKPAAGATDQE